MCYDERYFSEWAARMRRKGEERKSAIERRGPTPPPKSPTPATRPATDEPRQVERELETV
jgi:hypothetical protein